VDEPVKAIESFYKQLNVEFSKPRVRKYLNEHPALMAKLRTGDSVLQKHAKMALNLEEFGLSKEQVEESFTKYNQQFNL
jgi:hypothetical protein